MAAPCSRQRARHRAHTGEPETLRRPTSPRFGERRSALADSSSTVPSMRGAFATDRDSTDSGERLIAGNRGVIAARPSRCN